MKLYLKTHETVQIVFEDGTEMVVVSAKGNVTKVLMAHCDMAIVPQAGNSIDIHRISRRVPDIVTKRNMRNAGLVNEDGSVRTRADADAEVSEDV